MVLSERLHNRKRKKMRVIKVLSQNVNNNLTGNRFSGMHSDKRPKAQVFQMFSKSLKDFCSESTIHGIRYFMAHTRTERIWWLASIIMSVVLCTFVTSNIWTNWNQNPVVITFDDKTTPIAEIPFPAVTICPLQKYGPGKISDPLYHTLREMGVVDISSLGEYFFRSNNLNLTDVHHLDAIIQSRPIAAIYKTANKGFSNQFLADLLTENYSVYETIRDIAPSLTNSIYTAHWTINLEKREDFEPIFTEEGLCFTYNSINSDEIYSNDVAQELMAVDRMENENYFNWNMENGYRLNNIDIERRTFPRRVFKAGLDNSFEVFPRTPYLFESEYDCVDTSCILQYVYGYRLALHAPDDIPRFSNNVFFIPAAQIVYVSIEPKIMITSQGLQSYSPDKRGCFFKSERQLRFFQAYSQQNCKLECLTNYTMKSINCVKFWMPRDNNTKVCTIVKEDAYVQAKNQFNDQQRDSQCDCKPDCFSIEYEAYVSQQGPYEDKIYLVGKLTKMSILFKHSFISLQRSETNTMSNFLASFGGLLGLFMGFSVLSIVEIVYFFTLRLFYKMKQQKISDNNAQVTQNLRNNNLTF